MLVRSLPSGLRPTASFEIDVLFVFVCRALPRALSFPRFSPIPQCCVQGHSAWFPLVLYGTQRLSKTC